MRGFKPKGVFSAVSHVEKAVLVFLLVVELAHGQTATQQNTRVRAGEGGGVRRAPPCCALDCFFWFRNNSFGQAESTAGPVI